MQTLTPRKAESMRGAYKALRIYRAISDSSDSLFLRVPDFSWKGFIWMVVVIAPLVFLFDISQSSLIWPSVIIGLVALVVYGATFHANSVRKRVHSTRFSCPRCDFFIPAQAPWYCPDCKRTNPKSDNPYEFLDRCPNCHSKPTAYQCPHCPKEIALSHRPDSERVAYNPERAKLPSKKPPTMEEQLQQDLEEHRLREAHAHAKHGITAEEKLGAFKRWRALEKKHLDDLAQQLEAREISEEEYQDLCNQVIQYIAMNSTID